MRTVSSVVGSFIAVSASVAGVSSIASAQPASVDPGLSYNAPGTCPGDASFRARLRSRLGPSRDAAAWGRAIEVRIAATGGRYVGTLSVVDTGGRPTAKTLNDRDCDALVDALALVAALTLEADAAADPKVDAPVEEAGAPVPAPTAPPSAPAASGAPQEPVPVVGHASTESRTPASETSSVARVGVGVGGLAATGPAPEPLLGGSLVGRWSSLRRGLLSPLIEVGASASVAPGSSATNGTSHFAWLTARASVHVVRVALGAGVILRGGVTGDFGALLARGDRTTSPSSSARPWASLGAVTGLDVPVGSSFALVASVAIEAPLRRDRYAFGSTDFFEVRFVIGTGGLSLVAYLH